LEKYKCRNIYRKKIMVKLSVIVPAFNEEKYIADTLTSLKSQTGKDYELIVVNNNSTDKTGEIAKRFTKKVFLEKKKGYHNAVNCGVKKSSGRYITFCDADSIYPDNWVQTMIDAFEKDETIVAVYGGARVKENNFLLNTVGEILVDAFLRLSRFIGYDFASGYNLAYKKDAYKKSGGFDLKIYSGASPDNQLVRRLSKVGKIKFLPKLKVKTSIRRSKDKGLFLWIFSVIKTAYSIYMDKTPNISYTEYNKELR
jgi:glycosyltransferase involved in cell wall biosynthesis